MPDVADFDNQADWMGACVPARKEEGDEQDQAVAVCLNIWRERNKAADTDKARGEGQGVDGDRQEDGGTDMCVCPECGAKAEHKRGVPCTEQECPECGTAMVGLELGKAVDPNVGGGVDREKLDRGDFVFQDEKKFPIVTPGDVSDAVSSWGRYKGPHTFEEFKRRLMALCKRKGPSFVAALPKEWTEKAVDVDEGNHLKAVSTTADELRVANYIVVFGGRDLEGIASPTVNGDGTRGEYFTPETSLESTYTKSGILFVDWEHGADSDPGPGDVLGVVDWKTARTDERGVWVERVLNRRSKYVQWLESLIADGLVGSSSEAVPGEVEKAADGHIVRWPLRRDTLTVTPMEPRMLGENHIQAFKALGIPVPEDTADEPEQAAEAAPEADPSVVAVARAKARCERLIISLMEAEQ